MENEECYIFFVVKDAFNYKLIDGDENFVYINLERRTVIKKSTISEYNDIKHFCINYRTEYVKEVHLIRPKKIFEVAY